MRGRIAFSLSALATLWGVLLVVGALTVPVYSGSSSSEMCTSDGRCVTRPVEHLSATLIGENGASALVPVALPLAAALVCGLLLHRRCARGSRAALVGAWTLVALVMAFATVALFTIGLFVLPSVALLAASATLTPPPQPAV